jgi:gliding motility-associated-like protein
LFIIGSVSGLFIPEGFSPNGDGVNDKFVIENLDNETTLSLKVYNIWGMVVYEQADYKNEWDGNANAGTSPGFLGRAGLPDGTYLYSIHLSDNRIFMKYLTISR